MDTSEISPITKKTLISLPDINIPRNSIKFRNVSLQSNRFTCVRFDDHISIVNIASKNSADLKASVDSAIFNPTQNFIALKSGNKLQIFDLTKKKKINSALVTISVEFWTWIDEHTIALVTKDQVYHWSIDEDLGPQKISDNGDKFNSVQVIHYSASLDRQWYILGGISTDSDGHIDGILQLNSRAKKRSQCFEHSFSGCFAQAKLFQTPQKFNTVSLFCFTYRSTESLNLSIIQVGAEKSKAFRAVTCIKYTNDEDFPVILKADEKHSMLFLFSKMGTLHLFTIQRATCLFTCNYGGGTILTASSLPSTGGVVTLGQSGDIQEISVNEKTLAEYLIKSKNNALLAIELAGQLGLATPKEFLTLNFQKLLDENKITEAILLLNADKNDILRTPETLKIMKSLSSTEPGKPTPILQYFSLLLSKGSLNRYETLELIRPIAKANNDKGLKHIEGWIRDEKLYHCEELGDLLFPVDKKLACAVYLRSNCHRQVIQCFVHLSQFDKIVPYASKMNFQVDVNAVFDQLVKSNSDEASKFAIENCKNGSLDIRVAANALINSQNYRSATSFLLDILSHRGDLVEDADLQTQLFIINILHAPKAAEALMESSAYSFSHYEHHKIAQACEKMGMIDKALKNYSNIEDIKRCLRDGLAMKKLDKAFIVSFMGELTPDEGIECLGQIYDSAPEENLRILVEISTKYSKELGPEKLVAFYESKNCYNGLFLYLGSFINSSNDSDLAMKYIQCASKTLQITEIRRFCKESTAYDPKSVKDFLLQENLEDPRPLITVCDRFNFISEMVEHLYSKSMIPFIDAYVKKMNPKNAHIVIGALLDLSAGHETIKSIMEDLPPSAFSLSGMEQELERRDSLPLLRSWLERNVNEGSTDSTLHNMLGKIYIMKNIDPENFIKTDKHYDSYEMGKFCESRDPKLAFEAFKRSDGLCDQELIAISNKSGLFKEQAKYLVERQDEALWLKVLSQDNIHRKEIITQVVSSSLLESRVPEEISVAVKAFIAADLPNELIELLEKIVLESSPDRDLHTNKNLQNLLILTAIKSNPTRVQKYIDRLENYDGPDIARIAISDSYKLYEEAISIYIKFHCPVEAVKIMFVYLEDEKRAFSFAEEMDSQAVWECLGMYQLEKSNVKLAISCFSKGRISKHFSRVISTATECDEYESLIEFLEMARETMRNSKIDNELLYCYCKTEQLDKFAKLLSSEDTLAKVEQVGYRCLQEDLYEPARLIFEKTKNYRRLALCLINLGDFSAAVNAAKMANNIQIWKTICYACVDDGEFDLAQLCAMHVMSHVDHLTELIDHYESEGHFEQIIAVLEKGIFQQKAHSGIFTSLAVLYSKHATEKLMQHIKTFGDRMDKYKITETCAEFHLWPEMVAFLILNSQFDKAVEVTMAHSPSCWNHSQFLEMASHISRNHMIRSMVDFYLEEHPLQLNSLLAVVQSKIDLSSILDLLHSKGITSLVKDFLLSIQKDDTPHLNKTLFDLHLEEEDADAFMKRVKSHRNYDHLELAESLQGHPLSKFRSIAALLYDKKHYYDKSLQILQTDKSYTQMIETAKASGDFKCAENLLCYFVEKGLKKYFVLCFFHCRDFVRPHIVLKLAWENDLISVVMPFIISTLGAFDQRLRALEDKEAKREAEEKAKKDTMAAKERKEASDKMASILGSSGMLAIEGQQNGGEEVNSIFPSSIVG